MSATFPRTSRAPQPALLPLRAVPAPPAPPMLPAQPVAPPHPASEPECMRADQLARFLGVNRKTVYEYATRGLIPHRRLGRRIVFSRSQVVAWLGECKAGVVRKGS